jgi:PKD repeat protein
MKFGWISICLVLAALFGGCLHVHAAQPPLVSEISISPNDTPLASETVTFSVHAQSPAGIPLSYRWHFGDGTGAFTKEPSTTHKFAVASLYNISLEVNDGVNPGVIQYSFVDVIDPPTASAALGSNSGDFQKNPANGLSISVVMSQGGVVELLVDGSLLKLDPALREIRTDFGDGLTRNALGANPRHKYQSEGIFIAKTTILDRDAGSEVATIRKTIAISNLDLGLETNFKAPPENRKINVGKLKGKFSFGDTAKADQVNVTFRVELPKAIETDVARDIWLSVGNILEKISLDEKGKGAGQERYKKVMLKYPKSRNGRKLTGEGQFVNVSATLSAPDLDDTGFNTDGVVNVPISGKPRIQMAMIIAGVGYSGQTEVQFSVNPKRATGMIKGVAR